MTDVLHLQIETYTTLGITYLIFSLIHLNLAIILIPKQNSTLCFNTRLII